MVARVATNMDFNIEEAKTISVRRLLAQLIHDVTIITETRPLAPGESAESYVNAVERSINSFIDMGASCIRDCSIVNDQGLEQLKDSLDFVVGAGNDMVYAGRELIKDTSSAERRTRSIQGGRSLLNAVAHFLIMCDMIDVQIMVQEIDSAQNLLGDLKESQSHTEVTDRYHAVLAQIVVIEESTRRRIGDLADNRQRDDLLAARALLKTHAPLVFSATKAFVRHPESDAARLNLDYAHEETARALDNMKHILNGHPGDFSLSTGPADQLIAQLEKFQTQVYMEPSAYRIHTHRPQLEELLEHIVSGSAIIADSASTRPDRKQKIVDECNNLRQALQDLLSEYEKCRGRSDQTEDVDLAMVLVGKKSKDLRRHLRRAVVDHVSDAFLDTRTPLLMLIDAATKRDEARTHDSADVFLHHSQRMVEVAHLVCNMATDVEGARIIRYTAGQLQRLSPQVVNAAHLLCMRGDSKFAHDNMDAFRDIWLEKARLLTMAIDSITTLDDFLAVSEAHIVEDAMAGLQAVHLGEGRLLDQAAGAIRGRSLRVCSAVEEEMESMPINAYSDRVKMATKRLRDQLLQEFAHRAEPVVARLCTEGFNPNDRSEEERNFDSDEFINACTLVHEGVKEIRNALLVNRNPEDVDSDNEYEDDGQTNIQDGRSQVSDGDNQQRVMRRLPEEEKKKIQEAVDVFKITQTKFEREVAKWDETGNDIIVLAKHMCMIMMNMTDFTRGRGPLKTTMDVIRAAQEISVAGSKLNALAKQIGEESANSDSKNDLFAYLSRITLFCQQLNICSKVKADVQQVGNELVVSGLDSAMSLITTARNLLNAVVLTVKAAYIASTKFHRRNSEAPRVQWKMAPPKKQPLVRPQKSSSVIRRASERRQMPPMRALAEFKQ